MFKFIKNWIAERKDKNDGELMNDSQKEALFELAVMSIVFAWNGYNAEEKKALREQLKHVLSML